MATFSLGMKRNRTKPRGKFSSPVDPDVATNIRNILHGAGPIKMSTIPVIYQHLHGIPLCAVSMGFSRGLGGLFESLGNMVVISEKDDCLYMTLGARCSDSSDLDKENLGNSPASKRLQILEGLTEPASLLWKSFPNLLTAKHISIAKSQYDTALEMYGPAAKIEIMRIRERLKNEVHGIEVHKLFAENIKTRIFNLSNSIQTLVFELPEVFYVTKNEAGRDVVFDGKSHTVDIQLALRSSADPTYDKAIVRDIISNGLYQMTLILICETGTQGLKLNIWQESIIRNFNPSQSLQKYFDMEVMEFFFILARYQLIELGSSEHSKNDLRAFLPVKTIDLTELMLEPKATAHEDSPKNYIQADCSKQDARRKFGVKSCLLKYRIAQE